MNDSIETVSPEITVPEEPTKTKSKRKRKALPAPKRAAKRPTKRKVAKPKRLVPKTSKRSTPKPSPKRTPKRTAKKPKRKPSPTGSDRNPKEHIMSVHMPIALLAKLDRAVAKAQKAGKRSSRSAFVVSLLTSRL